MVAQTLLFEWDEAKSARNLRDRGFDFEFVTAVFRGPVVEEEDQNRHPRLSPCRAASGAVPIGVFPTVSAIAADEADPEQLLPPGRRKRASATAQPRASAGISIGIRAAR